MESYINQVDFFKGNDPEKIAQEYGTPLYAVSYTHLTLPTIA